MGELRRGTVGRWTGRSISGCSDRDRQHARSPHPPRSRCGEGRAGGKGARPAPAGALAAGEGLHRIHRHRRGLQLVVRDRERDLPGRAGGRVRAVSQGHPGDVGRHPPARSQEVVRDQAGAGEAVRRAGSVPRLRVRRRLSGESDGGDDQAPGDGDGRRSHRERADHLRSRRSRRETGEGVLLSGQGAPGGVPGAPAARRAERLQHSPPRARSCAPLRVRARRLPFRVPLAGR